MTEITKPEMTPHIGGLKFDWVDLGITVDLFQLNNDGEGEIWVYNKSNANGHKLLLEVGQINLRSVVTRGQFAKRLVERRRDVDWDLILNYIAPMTLLHIREGEPTYKLGLQPKSMRLEYLLYPILEKGQATTIFAPGGTVKSYIALYIACGVQYNIPIMYGSWTPEKGNVLYLDWESTYESHNRRVWAIKKGLQIDNAEDTILYRHCDNPLVAEITAIQKLVSDNSISLVIIDSQTPASGYGQDAGQVASQFFNSLRSLGCTSLVIDHVSKADMQFGGDSSMPINSIVKFNRSRSVFSLKKVQTPGTNYVYIEMLHTKHNEGRLQEKLGIKVEFIENMDGYLDKVDFNLCDLSEIEGATPKGSNLQEKIMDVLADGGRRSAEEIAAALDTRPTVISKTLSQMKKSNLVLNPTKGEWELVNLK